MNKCKKSEKLFDKALYNELNETEQDFFNEHLNSCQECAGRFKELKNTLSSVKSQTKKEPDEVFMESFWETLEPKLESEQKASQKKQIPFTWWTNFVNSLRPLYQWRYQLAGGLALLIIGIFIGEYFSNGNDATIQNSLASKDSTELRQTAVNALATNYIERSKVLLLGLMNFDPDDDIDAISLSQQKRISNELLAQTTELKEELNESGQQQLQKLVSDIELILLQIANLETKYDLSGIELIKEGVDSRGIILKINIHEMQKSSEEAEQPVIPTRQGSKRI